MTKTFLCPQDVYNKFKKSVKGVTPTDLDSHSDQWAIGLVARKGCLKYRFRIYSKNMDTILFQLGIDKIFDRWANSVNFEDHILTEFSLDNHDFNDKLKWCDKIVKSGLFDFNSYYYPVMIK